MQMNTALRIKLLCLLVAAAVIIGVAAPSAQAAVAVAFSGGDARQGHCGEGCPDPAGSERPCVEDCLCYFCFSTGVNAWILSSTAGLPALHESMAGAAAHELLDPRDVSIRIYHPPKF